MYTLLLLLFFSLSQQSQYVGPGSGGDQGPTAGAQTDNGCHLDPNGGCVSAFGDRGSEMDPNGVQATSDAGVRMDDNG